MTYQVINAQHNALEYLFGNNANFQDNRLTSLLKEISDLQRRVVNRNIEIGELENLRNRLQAKNAVDGGALKSTLVKAAILIMSIGDANVDPAEIFAQEGGCEARGRVAEVIQM